jgi:hypothetical protein
MMQRNSMLLTLEARIKSVGSGRVATVIRKVRKLTAYLINAPRLSLSLGGTGVDMAISSNREAPLIPTPRPAPYTMARATQQGDHHE